MQVLVCGQEKKTMVCLYGTGTHTPRIRKCWGHPRTISAPVLVDVLDKGYVQFPPRTKPKERLLGQQIMTIYYSSTRIAKQMAGRLDDGASQYIKNM
jgi:hypothetical protein